MYDIIKSLCDFGLGMRTWLRLPKLGEDSPGNSPVHVVIQVARPLSERGRIEGCKERTSIKDQVKDVR